MIFLSHMYLSPTEVGDFGFRNNGHYGVPECEHSVISLPLQEFTGARENNVDDICGVNP